MKNIFHNVSNVTPKLLVAALILATVSPFSLDAMKRLREGDNPIGQSPALKKQKTETSINEHKNITLVCHDGTDFQISYKVLCQSITLKNMVHDFIQKTNNQDNIKIPLPSSIASSSMKNIIRYMNEASFLSCNYTQEDVNSRLIQSIQNTTLYAQMIQNQDPALIIADYMQAAEWLDCELFSHALCHNFQENEPVAKKPMTEQEIADTLCALKCADGVMITEKYKVLSQSALFKAMFNPDKRFKSKYVPNGQKMQMYLDIDINSDLMKIMIKYMNLVTIAKAKGYSTLEIIRGLAEMIKATSFKYHTVETIKNYLMISDYLDFGLLSKALHVLIIQNLDTEEVFRLSHGIKNACVEKDYLQNGCLQKAYYLSFHKPLDPNNPSAISLHDLLDYGLLDDDVANAIDKYIIHLISILEFDRLQKILDLLTKHVTSLSIKAHHALVDYVKTLSPDKIKELFGKLHGESTLKMALRLVYAQTHKADLDDLPCNFYMENFSYCKDVTAIGTNLISEAYLQYVLPLIEPVSGVLVTKLICSEFKRTSVPDSIGNLRNLTALDLSRNKLSSLPATIGNLVNLRKLNIHRNKLNSLPATIGNLVNLTELDLAGNKLSSVPDSIGNLRNLTELNLCYNQLTSLPDLFDNFINLEALNLSSNKLSSLPDSIGNLRNLRVLNLSLNKLSSLPAIIGNLVNLKTLGLCNNKLARLPDWIDNLTSLEELYLFDNKLASLPDTIGDLTKYDEGGAYKKMRRFYWY